MREVRARFRAQRGLATRNELRALGVSTALQNSRLGSGEWELAAPGVIRLAGSPRTPEQDLLTACLSAGPAAVASHQSAAWWWDLADRPTRHSVTVPRGTSVALASIDAHQPVDYPPRVINWRGIPCTDPLRTIVDYAAVAGADQLDGAIDRGLAAKLFEIAGVEAELDRLSKPGRKGTKAIRNALYRRGLAGAPHPSVLESRALRLLRRGGLEPIAVEVKVGEGGRYRVDTMILDDLIVEFDGYAYHLTPEQKAEDERRRRRLRLDGFQVLVYSHRDVVFDGRRLLAEVHEAKAASEAARRRRVS